MNTNAGIADAGTGTGMRGTHTTTALGATTSAIAEMRDMGGFTTQAKVARPALLSEYYTVYVNQKICGRCERFSTALSKIPPDSEDAYILDKDMEKIYIFHRGKPNGKLENK